jgi:hypothetical protein
MTTIALTVFILSLLGISGLFALKHWELAHATVLAPTLRENADVRARLLKAQTLRFAAEAETWPPKAMLIARYLVHVAALEIGRWLHAGGEAMHRLADRLSHKHNFERRETQSRFLKEVASGKVSSPDGIERRE